MIGNVEKDATEYEEVCSFVDRSSRRTVLDI